MLNLFDNGTPAPLRYVLKGHAVMEAIERRWDVLRNGELIAAAEAAGFDILLTKRQEHSVPAKSEGPENRFCGSREQQWPTLRRYIERVAAAGEAATQGSYADEDIPFT